VYIYRLQVEPDAVVAADPDVIIVSPCGLDISMTKCEAAPLTAKSWW
jgi:ABC-type Fe3+-hydroxamate transport system substrate-binding protein